jgi:hypothetical protein
MIILIWSSHLALGGEERHWRGQTYQKRVGDEDRVAAGGLESEARIRPPSSGLVQA